MFSIEMLGEAAENRTTFCTSFLNVTCMRHVVDAFICSAWHAGVNDVG